MPGYRSVEIIDCRLAAVTAVSCAQLIVYTLNKIQGTQFHLPDNRGSVRLPTCEALAGSWEFLDLKKSSKT